MFKIIKFIIWLAGLALVAYFVLGYFGYEVNRDYFNDSRAVCQQKLKDCTDNLIHKGIDNAQCNLQCVSPSLIIKKK